MTPVIVRPEARVDALDAFAWYEERQAGLGVEFREALDRVVGRIAGLPLAYPVQYRDLRRALVARFPYAVFFRVVDETVVIVAIVHGRMDSRRWRSRH